MKGSSQSFHLLLLLLTSTVVVITYGNISGATDTIAKDYGMKDGETIVSSDGVFELGFFSPGNSKNRYVGIWYKNVPVKAVVWVANREAPLTNTTGVVLKVVEPGHLVLVNDRSRIIIWSSNTSWRSLKNPVAQLLPLGNLVLKDASDDDNRPERFVWQSFDHPTDTYLPGMKYGWNLGTGLETCYSSWRSEDDPGPGEFTVHLDPTGYPQILLKRGNKIVQRNGPWNGLGFSGLVYARDNPAYRLRLVMNRDEVSVSWNAMDKSIISRVTLSPSGLVQTWTWVNRTQSWVLCHYLPADNCDTYGLCGAYGICNIGNSPSCGCLEKFVPKDRHGWDRADWTNGCTRRTELSCQGDTFLKYSGIKMPDSRNSWFNETMTLEECRGECLRKCSCMAYTQLDIISNDGGIGCLLYFGDLIDMRYLYQDGQDLYIRMASSELLDDRESHADRVELIASITSVVGMVLVGLSFIFYLQKRTKGTKTRRKGSYSGRHAKTSGLQLFKLYTILKATNHFSADNKVGEGGFGPVYKGVLEEGQEIAVKRLSRNSKQGLEEFQNEVILIAKLQHRNLVRLLGCCIQGEENMLIYEYMPNKSLDVNLFDHTKTALLDWPKRFHIINGIARGLLYLHHDSRLRIIHRDLKTSNILLDSEMNPKISDFGMARSFEGNETQAKTRTVVGTYGYMSPEYAMNGIFSLKSDVFSLGVILLEIVSGKRNRGYSEIVHNLNLLGYSWTLYREGRLLELVDASLGDSFNPSEALRSIHVGLLCVQKCPEDRPSMSSVVFMLRNEVVLPEAKHPGFFMEGDHFGDGREFLAERSNVVNSVNDVTITLPGVR